MKNMGGTQWLKDQKEKTVEFKVVWVWVFLKKQWPPEVSGGVCICSLCLYFLAVLCSGGVWASGFGLWVCSLQPMTACRIWRRDSKNGPCSRRKHAPKRRSGGAVFKCCVYKRQILLVLPWSKLIGGKWGACPCQLVGCHSASRRMAKWTNLCRACMSGPDCVLLLVLKSKDHSSI